MPDETTPDPLRRELREINAEIAALGASIDNLKAREGDEVEDAAEVAADPTSFEENEAVLGIRGQRREAVTSSSSCSEVQPDRRADASCSVGKRTVRDSSYG